MSTADFIAKFERPELNSELHARLTELKEEMTEKGCIWLRSTIDPRTHMVYMEGWRALPIDQGPVPWQRNRR